jgi:phosphate-selective porin OprO/OprP
MNFNKHTHRCFVATPIAFTMFLLLPAQAGAQDVPPSSPRTTTPTDDSRAPPPEVAPAAASEATASDKGFTLASAGNPPAFVLKLGATLQADGRVYFGDPQKDNILLRRVRPIVGGTVIGLVDYYLMPDFGTGQTLLFDAYLDAHPFAWLRLRVGKFKAPIGLERLQTDSDLPLPERALTSDLSPVRDVGAQLWGEVAGGTLIYAIALLDGSPDSGNIDQDTGGGKDLAARIFVQPFKQAKGLGSLGVGVAATTGTRNGSAKSTSLVALKTVGQTTLFSYLAPATDAMGTDTVFASGRQTRLNPEIDYYYGPFGVLGEAIWSQQGLARHRVLRHWREQRVHRRDSRLPLWPAGWTLWCTRDRRPLQLARAR